MFVDINEVLDTRALRLIPLECSALRHLELAFAGQLTDPVLELIGSNCKYLHNIDLHGAFLCTSAGWASLFSNLQRITRIRLEFAVKFDDKALKTLCQKHFGTLRHVELVDCSLIGPGIQVLSSCNSLETLCLSGIAPYLDEDFVGIIRANHGSLKSVKIAKYNDLKQANATF
jgi:hypothetical protein